MERFRCCPAQPPVIRAEKACSRIRRMRLNCIIIQGSSARERYADFMPNICGTPVMIDPLKIKTRWFRLFASALLTFAMITASGCSDNRPVDEPNNASTAKTEPKTNTAETEIKTSSEASREAFHFVNSPLDERFSIITVEYQEQHQAVDLPAVMDAPIFAVADGTVQKAVPMMMLIRNTCCSIITTVS